MFTVIQHIDAALYEANFPSAPSARNCARHYWDHLDDHERYRLTKGLVLGTRPADAWCSFIERRAIEDRMRRASSGMNYGSRSAVVLETL